MVCPKNDSSHHVPKDRWSSRINQYLYKERQFQGGKGPGRVAGAGWAAGGTDERREGRGPRGPAAEPSGPETTDKQPKSVRSWGARKCIWFTFLLYSVIECVWKLSNIARKHMIWRSTHVIHDVGLGSLALYECCVSYTWIKASASVNWAKSVVLVCTFWCSFIFGTVEKSLNRTQGL